MVNVHEQQKFKCKVTTSVYFDKDTSEVSVVHLFASEAARGTRWKENSSCRCKFKQSERTFG